MNRKLALYGLVVPVAFGAYVAFHPGVAVAEPDSTVWASEAPVQSGTYTIDPMHTSISFEIGHMGIAKVHGRFNKFSGEIDYNESDVTKSSVHVTIQVSSVDTAVAPRDEHLRSADYFDVAKYPEMNFRSTAVRKTDKGFIADGALTIKGISKPVSIPYKLGGPVTSRGQSRIGAETTPITIKRSEFGMKDGLEPNAGLSDEVTIRIGAEATMGGGQ